MNQNLSNEYDSYGSARDGNSFREIFGNFQFLIFSRLLAANPATWPDASFFVEALATGQQ